MLKENYLPILASRSIIKEEGRKQHAGDKQILRNYYQDDL